MTPKNRSGPHKSRNSDGITSGESTRASVATSANSGNDTPSVEGEFYYALDHEIRRKIIKLIGDRGESSFTEFKKELGVSTGTLYHHLDVLKKMVIRNEKRKYILTPLGYHAYNFLTRNYDSIESEKMITGRYSSDRLKAIIYFIPRNIIDGIIPSKWSKILSFIGLLAAFVFLVILGKVDSIYLFFLPVEDRLSPSEEILLGIKFVLTVVIFAGITELLCKFLYGKNDNPGLLILLYPLAISPMLVYLLLYNIISYFFPAFPFSIFNKVLIILFQVFALWFISYVIVKIKYIKPERALLVVFLVHYIGFMAVLFVVL